MLINCPTILILTVSKIKNLKIMKTIIKLFAILNFLILLGCSKDDDDNSTSKDMSNETTISKDDDKGTPIKMSNETTISIENSETQTFQLKEIKIDNVNLKDTYNATLDNLNIILTKIDDNTLGLFIPNIADGKYNLDFELGNLDLIVSKTKLVKPKEEVIDEFKTMVSNNFVPNSLNQESEGLKILNDIIQNSNEEEKQAIATFLDANRLIFQKIINKNEEVISSKFIGNTSFKTTNNSDLNTRVGRYSTNVLQLGIGAVAVVGASALGQTGIGAILAGVGLGLIYDAIPAALNEGEGMTNESIKVIDYEYVSNNLSQKIIKSSKTNNTLLVFDNNSAKILNSTIESRTLDQTDRDSKDIFFFNSFFKSFDKLNDIISTINEVINITNKIPFLDISPISSGFIPNVGNFKNENISPEVFSNYSFSVKNKKISIYSAFKENGIIEITLTADESLDLSQPIETKLIINYNDELNDLNKEFDIILNATLPKIINLKSLGVGLDEVSVEASLIDNGVGNITERGFVYSLSRNPNIETDNKVEIAGTNFGDISKTIDNLFPNRQYYIRAYAISNLGVGYSPEITITTGNPCDDINNIKEQIIGNWVVRPSDPNSESTDLEMFSNGTGVYTFDGETYNMTWEVTCDRFSGIFKFTDCGFWHRGAFCDEISFPLETPITKITMESKFTSGQESRMFIKR